MSLWDPTVTKSDVMGIWTYAGPAAGYVVGFYSKLVLDRLAEARESERALIANYIAAARGDVIHEKDEFWRLGLLQKLGATMLSKRALKRVCNAIAAHYLTSPDERTIPVFTDKRGELFYLLKWAQRERVNLAEGDHLRRQAQETQDYVDGKRRKS